MRFINDDALNILKSMPDNSIDLIVTDPPYEFAAAGPGGVFGSKKKKYHSELKNLNITKGFNHAILDEMRRVMKKVNIYIWCNKNQLKDYLNYFSDCNMELLTWHKTNPVPTCNNKYLSDTEYCLFFREENVKLYGEYKTKKKYFISSTNKKDKELYNHPSIKPLDVLYPLVYNSSKEGDIVLDPFMGTGSTGVICKILKRDFIGIEIDKKYFDVAKNRIIDFNVNEGAYDGEIR